MKNLYMPCILSALLLASAFISCSDSDDPPVEKGSIHLSATLSGAAEGEIITDFTGYSLTVKKGDKTVYAGTVPADRTVTDLDYGNDYTVELTDRASGTAPSETPGYYGITRNVTVDSATTPSEVEVMLDIAGAGLRFSYPESLKERGFANIFPLVMQDNNTVRYTTHDGGECWYWQPGEVTVTLYNEEEEVPFDGNESVTVTLVAGETYCFDIETEKLAVKGPGAGPHIIENPVSHGRYTGTGSGGGGEFVLYIYTDAYQIFEDGYMCIALHGFTDPANSYEEWTITPGDYTVKEDAGAPRTISAGYYDGTLTQPSFLSWGTGCYDEAYFELRMTDGTVTVSREPNGDYTFITDVTIENRDRSIVMNNVHMEATVNPAIGNESPDPGGDGDLGRSEGYIIQQKFMTAFQVNLYRLEDADYTRGVTLEGYTDKQPSDEFILTPEEYIVYDEDEDYEEMGPSTFNLMPGTLDESASLYGTFGFRYGPASFTDAWLASAGDAYVRYNESTEEYTITVNISGTHLENGATITPSPFSGQRYEFKGKIEFEDITSQGMSALGYRPFGTPFRR